MNYGYENGVDIEYSACRGASTTGVSCGRLLSLDCGLCPELEDSTYQRQCEVLNFAYVSVKKSIDNVTHNTFDFFEPSSNGLFLRSFFGVPFRFEHLGSCMWPLPMSCDALDWDPRRKVGGEMLLF